MPAVMGGRKAALALAHRLIRKFNSARGFISTADESTSAHTSPWSCRMKSEEVWKRAQGRKFSAERMEQPSADDSSVLVRDFIHSALYQADSGYFTTNPEVVGTLDHPMEFNRFSGRRDYFQSLEAVYKKSGSSWFTPVELFQPWYGFALGEYILRTFNPKVPLKIYEIGGGTGRCALDILDYIKAHAPLVYESMSYTSVEISGPLADKQIARLGTVRSHKQRYHVENRSALQRDGWGSVNAQPCYIIMLEVLDNLPHDLVCKPSQSSSWMEVVISQKGHGGEAFETLRPLQDPLIKQFLDIYGNNASGSTGWLDLVKRLAPRFWPKSELFWIPTGCLQLLNVLHHVRPTMSLIAADFCCLPGVTVVGKGAPLVATKKDGHTKDYKTYLDAKGDGDIFFPTDFALLQQLDHHCSTRAAAKGGVSKDYERRISRVVSCSNFMRLFADISRMETKDGFNPLLEDYSNTKFFLSSPSM